MKRKINLIVIHCSATKSTQHYSVEDLRRDHLSRGFSDIGYHFYIPRLGIIQDCRPEEKVGAHVKGYNANSIGICYEGGLDKDGHPSDTRTSHQIHCIRVLVRLLLMRYPDAKVVGHRDLNSHKACPCYNVRLSDFI